MSFLQNYIVYLWLAPVTFQIVLPLVMFVFWMAGRLIFPNPVGEPSKKTTTLLDENAI